MNIDGHDSWIEHLRRNGEEFLAEAFYQHRDRLERIVDLRLDPLLSRRVDASDVLQEAFLEAQKRLSRYVDNPRVPVFVWLRGVTLDTLIRVHRRHLAGMRDARREFSFQTPQVSSVSLSGWLVADLTSPSQAAIRDEMTKKVEEALDAMKEIDREVLILRHFEQLSNDEVAAIVGVGKSAASRRYTRAIKRLRETLQTVPGFSSGE